MARHDRAETLAAHALAEPQRVGILRALQGAPAGLDVRTLARRTGLHPNTVRWHLAQLSEAGLVRSRRVHTGRPGRPRLVFEATDAPVESGGGLQLLATMLASAVESAPDGLDRAEETGRGWGRQLVEHERAATTEAAVGRVVALLADHGFAPMPVEDAIEMHHCPFAAVVDAHGAVVCTLHRGLIAGLLDGLEAPVALAALEPWARPGVCRAQLVDRATPISPISNSYADPAGEATMPTPRAGS